MSHISAALIEGSRRAAPAPPHPPNQARLRDARHGTAPSFSSERGSQWTDLGVAASLSLSLPSPFSFSEKNKLIKRFLFSFPPEHVLVCSVFLSENNILLG